VLGLVGLFCLYEAGEHGGELVYSYAGGVGIRSGDPADVDRLLLAGLYNGALAERKAGRHEDAAKLLTLAGERHPNDPEVQLAAAESLLLDRKDPRAAIEKLRSIQPPQDNRSLRIRHGMMTADALEAAGQKEGAAAVVQGLITEYPDVARLKQRLETLK
jgi:predicted Zn-dependent protease